MKTTAKSRRKRYRLTVNVEQLGFMLVHASPDWRDCAVRRFRRENVPERSIASFQRNWPRMHRQVFVMLKKFPQSFHRKLAKMLPIPEFKALVSSPKAGG